MKEISRRTERRRSVTQNSPVKENIPVMKKLIDWGIELVKKNTKFVHINYCAYNDINAPVSIHFDVVLYLAGKLVLAEKQKQTDLTKSTRVLLFLIY